MAKEGTTLREGPSRPESEGNDEEAEGELPEYERQRLARIKENQARLQALGLPQLASSLAFGSPPKRGLLAEEEEEDGKRTKRKSRRKEVRFRKEDGDTDDELYQPSENEDIDEDEEEEELGRSCSAPEAMEEEDRKAKKISSNSRRKGNKRTPSKVLKASKNVKLDGKSRDFDFNDENTALQQAIALSLNEIDDSAAGSTHSSHSVNAANPGSHGKREKIMVQENAGRRKGKNVKSRVQLTEDEVIAHFFSFDEVGKGYITVRDLQKMATAHDFCWTDNEISSMILSFDSDRDGKLSLEDFRTIICRCNMLRDSGDP